MFGIEKILQIFSPYQSSGESPDNSSSVPQKKQKRYPTCRACLKNDNVTVRIKNHVCPYKKQVVDSNEDGITDETLKISSDDDDEPSSMELHDSSIPSLLGKRKSSLKQMDSEESYDIDEEDSEDDESEEFSENEFTEESDLSDVVTPPPRKKRKLSKYDDNNEEKDKKKIISSSTSIIENITVNSLSLIYLDPKRIIVDDSSFLGDGAYGRVMKGYFDGAPIAAKVLYTKLIEEAEFMQNLRHPNILQYYGVCKEKNCLILELCDYDLSSVIITLKDDEVIKIAREISHGIRYLHSQNITHRDLKPGNILLNSGTVKLADFGISKCIVEANNTRIGTPHYMAPEIFKGVYGNEIDIYAFGLILYEMMSRTRLEKTLFKGLESFGVAQKIREGTKPTIPRRWKSKLCKFLRKMIHTDPAKRPKIFEVESLLETITKNDFPSK